MPLTAAQKTLLKAHIDANTTVITVGGVPTQIKDVPNTPDTNADVKDWYNQPTAGFWVWRTSVSRSEVYHGVGPGGTVFDWGTFKAQAVAEQNAWVQMFMGDQAPFHRLAFRNGVFSVFSGSGAQNAQRAHIFSVGRRLATRAEQVLAVAPASEGGVTVGANNGNAPGDAAGASTNPHLTTYEAPLTTQDVTEARNS